MADMTDKNAQALEALKSIVTMQGRELNAATVHHFAQRATYALESAAPAAGEVHPAWQIAGYAALINYPDAWDLDQFATLEAAVRWTLAHRSPPAPSATSVEPEWIDDPHDIEQGQIRNPKYIAPAPTVMDEKGEREADHERARTLEIIALRESTDPAKDANAVLVETGWWSGCGVATLPAVQPEAETSAEKAKRGPCKDCDGCLILSMEPYLTVSGTNEALAALSARLKADAPVAEPVAHCQLTPSGKIAHFDGKPMVMVGPVGNDCHPDPLYTRPPAPEDGKDAALPMQPLHLVHDVIRFKKNELVSHLLDHGTATGCGMNELAQVDASDEDRQQFAQLIGYSVAGYAELGYVSDESYDRAEREAEKIRAALSQGGGA